MMSFDRPHTQNTDNCQLRQGYPGQVSVFQPEIPNLEPKWCSEPKTFLKILCPTLTINKFNNGSRRNVNKLIDVGFWENNYSGPDVFED